MRAARSPEAPKIMTQVGWAPRCLLRPVRKGWRSVSDIGFKGDDAQRGLRHGVEGCGRCPCCKPELRPHQSVCAAHRRFRVASPSPPVVKRSFFAYPPPKSRPLRLPPSGSSLPRKPVHRHRGRQDRVRRDRIASYARGYNSLSFGKIARPRAPRGRPNQADATTRGADSKALRIPWA